MWAVKLFVFVVFASSFALGQAALPDAADALFESPALEDIRLTVKPSDWLTLKERYLENTYYEASFAWRDKTIRRIGIRSRGNGSRSPVKPSLKLDFAKYESASFLGLKSLIVKNMTQDPPMLREYLSMALFRKMGLPAPRENYVRLFVNDEYQGLYIAIEPLDKVFLKRTFKDDTGDLFSLDWAWPYHFENLGPVPEAYCPFPFKPETNEKSPNAGPIAELAGLLDTLPDEEIPAAVGARFDVDNLLGHLAVDTYIAATDGFLGDLGMNNFYLYRAKPKSADATSKMKLLAWDKDACFAWYDAPLIYHADENVLTRRILTQPAEVERYVNWLVKVAETAGGEGGWLLSTLDEAVARILEAGLADPNKPYSNSTFEQSIGDTRFFVLERNYQVGRALGKN